MSRIGTSLLGRRVQAWFSVALLGATAKLTAQGRIWFAESNTRLDEFGHAVAVVPDANGDRIEDLLIGAPGVNCGSGTGDGAAYLFSTGPGGQLNMWCGSASGRHERLGSSVSSIGDVDTDGIADILIGAPSYHGTLGRETGHVLIFSADDGARLLELFGEPPIWRLGFKVSGLPDLNGDGFPEFLVAALGSGAETGRVNVYSSKDGALLRSYSGSDEYAFFGISICSLHDADGDGIGDYVVAAANAGGDIFVYSGASGQLIRQWTGTPTAPISSPVRAADDMDGDGLTDVMFAVNSGNGTVRVCSPESGATIFEVGGEKSYEGFGSDFATLGDMNGDGYIDFAVGAQYDDHDGYNSGRVTLFSGKTLRPLYRFYPGYAEAELGQIVNGGADFNQDGIPDLVVAAPGSRYSYPKGGRVSVYAGNDLFLQADKTAPKVGDAVTLAVRGGETGALALMAIVAIDGTPMWSVISLSTLDANGELIDSEVVPPEVSGHDFTLIGYAVRSSGKIIDTGLETVAVQ